MLIKYVKANIVKDSRNQDTIEVIINNKSAKCPSGKSKGKHEARTVDAKKAVNNIDKIIAKNIIGKDLTQEELDKILIRLGGKNKSKIGANSTTAISIAFCKASSENLYKQIGNLYGNNNFSIPIPFMNVINGGVHAKNKLSIQEFIIIPTNVKSFFDAFKICIKIYNELKIIIKEFYEKIKIGDEGGFSPPIEKTEHALNLLNEAVKRTGYEDKIKFGLDAAASQFYKNGKYKIDGQKLTAKELQNFYKDIIERYSIIYIEDPFYENDWKSFVELTKYFENRIMIAGDDLLTTNIERIKKAIKLNACNSIILKINQIGTVSEALEAAKLAMKNSMHVIVSHRSGETTDSFISDFAVGIGCGFIKAGAPFTPYRLAKYKRLIQIEKETGTIYAGNIFKF
ncbi:MAG: enolase C-terminal domain-like protein [Candidatus Aenigmatarchaeota archaeon]